MKLNRCLYCYQELTEEASGFHPKCSKAFFGTAIPPSLSLSKEELDKFAKEIIKKSITIPGVQPKLSLNLQKNTEDPKKSRLTIVGLWGEYILKPQSEKFKNLPENEDLIMHLAEIAGIETAKHTLLKTEVGDLVYLTKRFDRLNGKKVPMEDFCQLAGQLSADKYKSSMEKAGALIQKYSSTLYRTTDTIKFFEIALFSFLIGNSDMHLKNFSIIKDAENQYKLSPAYDLLSSNLAMPADKEQTALTLHGKKNRLRKPDFLSLAEKLGISESIAEKIISRFSNSMRKEFEVFVSKSFMPAEAQEKFIILMHSRFNVLN